MAASVDITINAQDNASSVFGGFTVTLGDVMNVAGKVIGAVSDMFSSTVKAAEEQQDVSAQLQAGLKSTGGAAGVTMQQMQDLAEAQSKVTDFSKLQTEAIEKVALTFTSVNKDIFPQTISLSEDMAQRLGIQGSQAMTMIGKAMDDPIKGMGALHRVGVSFTDQQKDQIKALVAAGDTMGAQKILLGELSKEYGGSATAAGATFAGQQAILAHQFDEVKEKIGTALLPVLAQLTGMITSNVLPVVQQFAQWFSDNLPGAIQQVQETLGPVIATIGNLADAFQTGATDGGGFAGGLSNLLYSLDTISPIFDTVGDAVNTVADAFDQAGGASGVLGAYITTLQRVWAALAPTVTNVVSAIQNVVMAVFSTIQTFIAAHGTEISANMTDAWTRIQAIIKTGIELYNAIVPPVLNAIATYIRTHGAAIQAILGATWTAIKAVIDIALTLIQGVITVALDLIHGNWQKAWEDIKTMSAAIVTDLITIVRADLEILKTVFAGAITWISDEWKALPGQLSNVGNAIVKAIQDGFESAWESFKASMLKKLQDLKDQLPFSEPKNSSSPLYGLGKSGAAIVANMQAGMDSAPKLTIGGVAVGRSSSGSSGGGDAAASSGNGVVHNWNIDARNSKMSPDEFKKAIGDVLKDTGAKALSRQLVGG